MFPYSEASWSVVDGDVYGMGQPFWHYDCAATICVFVLVVGQSSRIEIFKILKLMRPGLSPALTNQTISLSCKIRYVNL